METRDLDRIRFVTRHFRDLQGLQYLVPLGLMILSGAGMARFPGWALALLFLGALLLLLGARRYYRNTFGEVEQPVVRPVAEPSVISIFCTGGLVPRLEPGFPFAQRCMLIVGLVPPVLILFMFLFWPPWIGMDSSVILDPTWSNVPLFSPSTAAAVTQMIYPLCGSLFLGIWWSRGRRLSQGYHLGIGALLLGIFFLGPRFVPAAAHPGVTLLVCGSSMVLAGLLDHWQLVRILAPREEE